MRGAAGHWFVFLWASVRNTLRADLALLGNAALSIASMLIVHGLQLAAVLALLETHRPETQLPFLGQLSIVLLSWGLIGVFFEGLRKLAFLVESGEMESYLAGPLPPLLLASASSSNVASLVDIAFALVLLGIVGWQSPLMALLALGCLPMALMTFAALFALGGAAALRMRGGGAVSDFLVFTTFTLSSLPSSAGFKGGARFLLYALPALFTAQLPYQALAQEHAAWIPLGTCASAILFFLSVKAFSAALGRDGFASLSRMRR